MGRKKTSWSANLIKCETRENDDDSDDDDDRYDDMW
jgi:hypothetical protein